MVCRTQYTIRYIRLLLVGPFDLNSPHSTANYNDTTSFFFPSRWQGRLSVESGKQIRDAPLLVTRSDIASSPTVQLTCLFSSSRFCSPVSRYPTSGKLQPACRTIARAMRQEFRWLGKVRSCMNDPPEPRNRGHRVSCLVNCPKPRQLVPIRPHIERPGRGYPTRPFTPNKS